MRLFLFLLNLSLVLGNNEIVKHDVEYQQCFTLPPKTTNNLDNMTPYECPPGYIRYQNYFEYLNIEDINNDCAVPFNQKLDKNLSKEIKNCIVKIHSICCKKY